MKNKNQLSFNRSEDGATAIEFAIIAFPLFFMILGTIEAARVYWSTTVINDISQAGARCLGLPEQNCPSEAAAANYMLSLASTRGVKLSDDDITIIPISTVCTNFGGFVEVRISTTVETVIGYDFPISANACHINQSN